MRAIARAGALALAALLGAAPAWPQAVPDARLVSGELAFEADASAGDFEGVTRDVSGEVRGGASLADVRGWVSTPAASLRTGIGMRDRHMRGSLEAERFPTIRLDVAGAEPAGTRGDTVLARVHGRLTIRDQTRDVVVPVAVVRSADGFHVSARFPIDVSEYGVGGLSRMGGMLKVKPRMMLRAELEFRAAGAP